jgi:hypothetical protein
MSFSDLIFKKHPIGEGFQAIMELRDGKTLSVVANEGAYCTPRKTLSSPDEYSSFEIAIMDEIRDWDGDSGIDVRGWQSRDEITEIINQYK